MDGAQPALYAILTSSPLSATTTDPTTTNKTAMTTRNSNENVGKTSTTQSKKEKITLKYILQNKYPHYPLFDS